MVTIQSRPPTDDYRDGWERVFGSKRGKDDNGGARFVPVNEYRGKTDKIGKIGSYSVGFGETNKCQTSKAAS